MGSHHSSKSSPSPGEEVNFDHFEILRAIGKGSFGKVCIVQKRDRVGNMYAMKYVHKGECAEKGALKNVIREVEILSKLEYPFIVNLWFSFQDEEDLFMVSDLLLGGDLRYHINKKVKFSEDSVIIFIAEIALALNYLQKNKIIHRDIKPDNILLDEEGHAHVTDFNIATVLEDDQLATSMSGTKCYIAPEVYMCFCEEVGVTGYGYPVDWWSLGILGWETLSGSRPFELHSSTSYREALKIMQCERQVPAHWSTNIREILDKLLIFSPKARVSTLSELKLIPAMRNIDLEKVLSRQIKPTFTPPKDHLNCDPTFELEEMIIETKPLHKKKKRLAKQRSLKAESTGDENLGNNGEGLGLSSESRKLEFIPQYRIYNREKEIERMEKERKEKQWEEELNTAMKSDEEKLGGERRMETKRLNVSTIKVKARLNGSPTQNQRKNSSVGTSSDIDFIDASPEPSMS